MKLCVWTAVTSSHNNERKCTKHKSKETLL